MSDDSAALKRGDRVFVQRHGCGPAVLREPGTARVMAVADGYAMCRYKGCIPFAEPVKYLRKAEA